MLLLFTTSVLFAYAYLSSSQIAVGKREEQRIEVDQTKETFGQTEWRTEKAAEVKNVSFLQTSHKTNQIHLYNEQMESLKKDRQKKSKKEDKQELTIMAVGDDLIHTQVIKSGQKADGSYNFDHLFDGIQDEIDQADIAIINQETILCSKSRGYTGYPTFGSPYAIGKAIHKAGFDVVLHATNHTLDKGVDGILDTQKFWSGYDDIVVAGINQTKDASERVKYMTKNGMTLAILNYTYGLNGLRLPKGKEYMINLLTDQKQMKKDIKTAKKHSDFVIVAPHWGTEYVYKPTKAQEELTQFFLQQGVDLVIGTHPHVLEPVKWVKSEDGEHKMLVYYSLGNFVSNQDAMARMLGGMAKIKLVKKEGQVVIDEASIEPLVTHTYYDGRQRFVTYLLKDYDKTLASKHYLNKKRKNTLTVSRLKELSAQILGKWYERAS